jgi:hypothetical protein
MRAVWQANGVILNSMYELPPNRTIWTSWETEEDAAKKTKIAEEAKITVLDGRLAIVFNDNRISVRQDTEPLIDERAIIYFVTYKTFLNYNVLTAEPDSKDAIPETDGVSFNLHRYVTRHGEENGKPFYYTDTEPCQLLLAKKDVTDFLIATDEALWYSICYYLLGCDTARYFLVEFYKCLEVIRYHFGNETKMTAKLTPHGFQRAAYNTMKKLADDRMRPLSIGRHAPRKGIKIEDIDTKWLFSNATGRKVFETSEKACRNIIDSYIQFRVNQS